MKLINKHNGGAVEVNPEFGERLIATGDWEKPKAPVAPKKTAPAKPKAKTEED